MRSYESPRRLKRLSLETGKKVICAADFMETPRMLFKAPENPYFRTEWLLMPILPKGIDLYNFKYLTDKTLVYEGEVNHTPIKITFKFSKLIGHCHYHIWYK